MTKIDLSDVDTDDLMQHIIDCRTYNNGIESMTVDDIGDSSKLNILIYSFRYSSLVYCIDERDKEFNVIYDKLIDIARENDIRIKEEKESSDYKKYLELKARFEDK